MMKARDLKEIKKRINEELLRRNGYDSVAHLAGPEYQFSKEPVDGEPISAEYGEKTLNLLLQVSDFGGIKKVVPGDPIPEQFNAKDMNAFLDKLSSEKRTGEPDEKSSCYSACTGLCVGSCIGLANIGAGGTSMITTGGDKIITDFSK